MATVSGMEQGITEYDLTAIANFEDAALRLAGFKKDINWLNDEKLWGKTQAVQGLPFMSRFLGTVPDVKGMRDAAIEVLGSYSLNTMLSVTEACTHNTSGRQPTSQTVLIAQVLGRVQRSVWLNDAVVNFALHSIAAASPDVIVIDSPCSGRFDIPRANLRNTRLVVFPIDFSNNHWCVITVQLDWAKKKHSAVGYDPLHDEDGWEKSFTGLWKSWCLPLMVAWTDRDRGYRSLTDQDVRDLADLTWQLASRRTPKQEDNFSCGVFCISHAIGYMTDDFRMQEMTRFSPPDLQIMRLRIAYVILVKSDAHMNEDEKAKFAGILKKFDDHMKKHPPPQTMTTRTKRK